MSLAALSPSAALGAPRPCARPSCCSAHVALPARAAAAASTSGRLFAPALPLRRRAQPTLLAAEGSSGGPPAPSPTREEAAAADQAAAAAAKPKGQRVVIDLDDDEDEAAKKKAEAERLRAAEKFMVVGSGEAKCKGCGYEYSPAKGDPDFPVAKGVAFQDTPQDYSCPVCGAPRSSFESRVRVVAGFAENQGYGLGTNSMTGGQKSALIYGALAVFFALFLAGYALE